MIHIRTYEGYYDPPDDEDPLYEEVLDNVYSILILDKSVNLTSEQIDGYLEFMWQDNKMYEKLKTLIWQIEEEFMDDDGNYPWSEELINKHKYEYRDQVTAVRKRLSKEIGNLLAEKIKKGIKGIITIEDYLTKIEGEKFNM